MAKLGQDFDIGTGIIPVDLADGTNTGHRLHLKNYGGVCFVGYIAVGTAAQAPTFTVQEHDAATAGTSQNLVVVATYYEKTELALDGDEAWAKSTQTAAATVTDATWDDAGQSLIAFEVEADQLSDGFDWLSVNIGDPGTAHLGCVFHVMYDLATQRAPANLAQPNA